MGVAKRQGPHLMAKEETPSEWKARLARHAFGLSVLLIVLLIGINYRLTHKLDNFGPTDIREFNGTIQREPRIVQNGARKRHRELQITLREWPAKTFRASGIHLALLDEERIIKENRFADSITITVPEAEWNDLEPTILALKTPETVYLTIQQTNTQLAEDKPLRDGFLYAGTGVVVIALVFKLLLRRKLVKRYGQSDTESQP